MKTDEVSERAPVNKMKRAKEGVKVSDVLKTRCILNFMD